MTTPPTLGDDEKKFRALGEELADAIDQKLAIWVEAQVHKFWNGDVPTDVQRQAAEAAARSVDEIIPKIRHLLELDIDDQWTNPLTLVRTATHFATRVLTEAGIPPVHRDATAQKFHPEDIYDLTPGGFGDLGPEVGQAGLVWGAAKAHVHLRRRRVPPSEVSGDR